MMAEGVVVIGEADALHHAHHEQVTQYRHHRSAGGGGEPEGADLLRVTCGEADIDLPREGAIGVTRDQDEGQGGIHPAGEGNELQHLTGLTRVADQQHHIAGADHPEVTMLRLARVQEVGRCTCGAEGRSDVMSDLPRLTHP